MTEVYYGKLSAHGAEEIADRERRKYIESFKTEQGQKERINAWILLGFALKDKQNIKDLNIKRDENGKWVCDDVYFSLSHSGNGVAVAVSDMPIGVDIERIFRKNQPVSVLNEREKSIYLPQSDKDRAFAEIWTKKESIFKKNGKRIFLPKKTDSASEETLSKFINIDGEEYCLSVTGREAEFIEVREDDGLIVSVRREKACNV